MNTTAERLIQVMLENNQLDNDERIGAFADALMKLRRMELQPNLLPSLYAIFDDGAWHRTPLDALITYIAAYDMKLQVDTLIEVTPSLLINAKKWLALLYRGMLMNPDSRTYLKELIPLLPEPERNPLLEFLEYLRNKEYSSEEVAGRVRTNIQFVLNED